MVQLNILFLDLYYLEFKTNFLGNSCLNCINYMTRDLSRPKGCVCMYIHIHTHTFTYDNSFICWSKFHNSASSTFFILFEVIWRIKVYLTFHIIFHHMNKPKCRPIRVFPTLLLFIKNTFKFQILRKLHFLSIQLIFIRAFNSLPKYAFSTPPYFLVLTLSLPPFIGSLGPVCSYFPMTQGDIKPFSTLMMLPFGGH